MFRKALNIIAPSVKDTYMYSRTPPCGRPTHVDTFCLARLFFLFICNVAVNHENDTCFENGLVMGYADCKCYAGLVETSKVVSIISLALCQTHCKQVPVFSHLSKSDLIMWASFDANTRSTTPVPTYGSIWVVLWLLFFRSAPSTFPQKNRSPSRGHSSLGVLSNLDYTRNWP